MATLTGEIRDFGLSNCVSLALNTSMDITYFYTREAPADTEKSLINNPLISNPPVSMSPTALQGSVGWAWFDSYYNRIHVVPSKIALGDIAEIQYRTIEVWNAYLVSKTLSSIKAIDASGTTLTGPAAPAVWEKLQHGIYNLTVSTNGDPNLNAVFEFVFSGATSSVLVTGRRVIVNYFVPKAEFTESLEWSTDVIRSVNGEQRISLRKQPRQKFKYQYHLKPDEFSKMKLLASAWAFRQYSIPVWIEARKANNALSAGATSISVNTQNADFRIGSLIAVWDTGGSLEAVEVTNKTSNTLSLKTPLTKSYTSPNIAPMRFAYALGGVKFSRSDSYITEATMEFDVTDNTLISLTSPWPQYQGLDLINKPTIIMSPISESIYASVDVFDNDSGILSVDTKYNDINKLFMVSWFSENDADRWVMRGWLHKIRGKAKAFWLPTWHKDFEVQSTISSSTVSILVKQVGYWKYESISHIMIELNTGDKYYAKVLSSVDAGANEQLLIETALGVTIQPADIKRVSRMHKVRFDTDKIEIQYQLPKMASFSAPVKEVIE